MRPIHWLIVLLVLLILFGAPKLPDIAHSIGRSAKILKDDLKDLQDDPADAGPTDAAQASQQAGPTVPQAEVVTGPAGTHSSMPNDTPRPGADGAPPIRTETPRDRQ